MSKYTPLWEKIAENAETSLTVTFAEAERILGFPLDHSFLSFKKELTEYGWRVEKISMKHQTVLFQKEV